jgi:hypothetical protein
MYDAVSEGSCGRVAGKGVDVFEKTPPEGFLATIPKGDE